MGAGSQELVPLGRISGVFGLQGWVKVYSDTQPREGIVDYDEWILLRGDQLETWTIEKGKRHGKGVIAKIKGVNDRNSAELLVGRTIAVRREVLPELAHGEYYWSDLIGLTVVTLQGEELGSIDHLFATGANDVIVVRGDRERLIPWIKEEVIKNIDLDDGIMEVDWDPDF